MNCIYCKASILEHAPFCDQCGKPQTNYPEEATIRNQLIPTGDDATIVAHQSPGLANANLDLPTVISGNAVTHVPMQPAILSSPEHIAVEPAQAFNDEATIRRISSSDATARQDFSGIQPKIPAISPTPAPLPGSFAGGMQPPTYPPAYNPYPQTYIPITPPTPREPHKIARPLPLWAFLGGIVLMVAALAALQFTGSDWADGTQHIAFGAIGFSVLIIIITVIRSIAGMSSLANPSRVRQYISAILVIVLLFMSSGVALLVQPLLHTSEGSHLEGLQNWELAIKEYEQGGDKAPTSVNIARTYVEWGESLSKAQSFEPAISKFDTMISYYPQATTILSRAQQDKLNAYIGWGKLAMDKKNYSEASQRYDIVLNLSNCDSNCKTTVGNLDATAYYNVAEASLTNKSYDDAINAFKTIQTKFPTAPEVKQMHGDLAQALSGKGRQDRSTNCPSAIPTYKELASNFSDTPEGQQANQDLNAPQLVKGRFTQALPAGPFAELMQGLAVIDDQGTLNMSDNDFFSRAHQAPTVNINADGTFAFPPMKQGTYQLIWGSGQVYYFYFQKSTHKMEYEANVGQLCTFDFGDISSSFVTKS